MSPEGKFEVGADGKRRGVGFVLQLRGEVEQRAPGGEAGLASGHRNSTKKKQICWGKAPGARATIPMGGSKQEPQGKG